MATKPGIKRDLQGKLIGAQYIFGGMNNIIDPTCLEIETGKVIDGVNVDFDNLNATSLRRGYTKVYNGSFHSGWNNNEKTTVYMVSNGWIFEFDGKAAPYAIVQLSNNNRCEFCQVNDTVAYSNGMDFGLIGGSFTQRQLYSPAFKKDTLGGRCLEFYHGRLYFARGTSLFCTDTFDIEHVDVRHTRVATFPHTITMCQCVNDGLWIGTEQYVYFLPGEDVIGSASPWEGAKGGFRQSIVAKAGVVYGSACKLNAEFIPEAQNTDTVIVFLTTKGVCSGGNTGKYFNHSFNEMSFDANVSGIATIRNMDGLSQYVVVVDVDEEFEYNPFSVDIDISVTEI
jgi:hypothetical protein